MTVIKTYIGKLLFVAAFLPSVSTLCSQEWEVFSVGDPAFSTAIHEINHEQLVGSRWTADFGTRRAALWEDAMKSPVHRDFQPANAFVSEISSFKGNQYAGYARIAGVDRATLWDGSMSGYRDLHPVNSTSSRVFATIGFLQGGYATRDTIVERTIRGIAGPIVKYVNLGKFPHAVTWRLTSQSFVDHHPQNARRTNSAGNFYTDYKEYEYSTVLAVSGNSLGGYAGSAVDGDHAGVWVGPGFYEFWDMHPSGAISSRITGLEENYQVGYANFGGSNHAGIWRGTEQTFVDLNPKGASDSIIAATSKGIHCGTATFGSSGHAFVWNSETGESFDLHASLPTLYSSSSGSAVWTDGRIVLVGGTAFNAASGKLVAMVWRFIKHPEGIITFNSNQSSYSLIRKDGSSVHFESYKSSPRSIKSVTLVSGKDGATKGLKLNFKASGILKSMVDSSGTRMSVKETRTKMMFRIYKTGSKRAKVVTITQRRPKSVLEQHQSKEHSFGAAEYELFAFQFKSPFRLRLEQFGVNREELATYPIVGKDLLAILDSNMEKVNEILTRVTTIATRGRATATKEIIQTLKEDALDFTLSDDEAYKIVRPSVDAVVTYKGVYDFFENAEDAVPNVTDLIELSDNLEDAFETMTNVYGWAVDPKTGVALSELLPFLKAAPRGFALNGNGGNNNQEIFSTTFRSATGTGRLKELNVSALAAYGPGGFTATANVQLSVDGRIVSNTGTQEVALTYGYSGNLDWDGVSFSGTISGSSGSGYLSIVYDSVAKSYYAGVTLPVTYRVNVNEGGVYYQQPLQTTTYSPDSFYLD